MTIHAESKIQLNTIPVNTSLLGGHFLYKSSDSQTGLTKPSANVIQYAGTPSDPTRWGYNTNIGANGIKLRHNETTLSEWNTNGLTFYTPGTNNPSLGLNVNGLTFYKPNGIAAAALTNSGLTLQEGGIIAGTAGQTEYIYLSTIGYPLKDSQVSPSVAGITINDYTPTKTGTDGRTVDDSAWRQIIGTKFGVQSDGTLHAAGARISGKISITSSLTIENGATISDTNGLISNNAINVGGRNLLLGTGSDIAWEDIVLNGSNQAINDYYKTCQPIPMLFSVDDLVTISFDWITTATGGSFYIECGNIGPQSWGTIVKSSGTSGENSNRVDITSSNMSGHCTITFKIDTEQVSFEPSSLAGDDDYQGYLRIRVDGSSFADQNLTMSNAKAERGNVATDWTLAPEDIETNLTEIEDDITTTTNNINNLTTEVNTNTQDIIKAGELISGNSQAIEVHNDDISVLQSNDAAINTAIATTNSNVERIQEDVDKIIKGIDIDPDVPHVIIYTTRSSVKITDSDISIKGDNNTSTWITDESIISQAVISPEIRPWSLTASSGAPIPNGNFVIVGRGNGHLSITKI